MTDLRQAAIQALEALTIYSDAQCSLKGRNAITALRTALAALEQEPISTNAAMRDARLNVGWGSEQQAEPVDCPRCGHVCSQRPWQGLTDEDVNRESSVIDARLKLAFHSGMYVAQNILKERNT
jgi:hypothetical protein